MSHEQTVLKEADFRSSQPNRVVKLSGDYGNTIQELIATLEPTCIEVVAFREGTKARRTSFTNSELDTLCAAWAQFKADADAARDAEALRQAAVITAAMALAATVPAIQVDHGPGYWAITVPAIGWGNERYLIYSADELLSRVKLAFNVLRKHIIALREEDKKVPLERRINYREQRALLEQYGYLAGQDELERDEDQPF